MQQVEKDEHALSRRQASLDDRFEAAERAAGDGDGAAGDDGVDLDDAVGPRAGPQVYDHLGSHAGRRVAERDEAQRTAATREPAQVERIRLAENVAWEHRHDGS